MDEMYICLELVVYLKDGTEIRYLRDSKPDYNGYFAIYGSELRDIRTLQELIKTLEKQELLHLTDGDCIDIDEFCEYLIEKNGKEFIPDEDVECYTDNHGYGMSGGELVEYWEAYQENKKIKGKFLRKIKKLSVNEVEKVVFMKLYESFGMEMDDYYEDEIYTVNLMNR